MINNKIHVSAPELIYSDDELNFTFHGSCCTLRRPDGKIDFWTTTGTSRLVYKHFRGTLDEPFREELPEFEWDHNNYRCDFPCGLWVQSFYRCDDGMLIGFVHREEYLRDEFSKNLPDYPQSYHLGFAVSFDDGQHWKYLGDALGTVCNHISLRRSGGKYPNVGGVPFFAGKDGYFYFYFNEYNSDWERYVSGARLPMKEAIEMIRRGESPAPLVKKYSGGNTWDTEAMHGTAAKMLPGYCDDVRYLEECGYKYDCHSDAAYCSALDKYVLVIQTARQVVLFFSDEGAHWDEHKVIATADPYTGLCYYSTIVGADGEASDDFSTVGHDFYVYYTHKVGFLRLPGNYGDYKTDMLYRVLVTVD